MNSLFLENGDMTEFEFECSCAQKEFDVAMAEINFMLEMVEMNEKLNHEKAELKVMQEGGTVDDLAMLYTEASDEAGEKSKGIIGTLISRIAGFFQRIGDAFLSLFKNEQKESVPDDTPMTIPAKELTKIEKARSILDQYKGIIILAVSTITGAALLKKWNAAKAKIENIEGGTDDGSSDGDGAEKETTAGEVRQGAEKASTVAKDAKSLLDKLREFFNKDDGSDKEKTGVVRDILNSMSSWAQSLMEVPGKLGRKMMKFVGKGDSGKESGGKKDPDMTLVDDDGNEVNHLWVGNKKLAAQVKNDRTVFGTSSASKNPPKIKNQPVKKNAKSEETDEKKESVIDNHVNGVPTFESGSIDDIMELINSL